MEPRIQYAQTKDGLSIAERNKTQRCKSTGMSHRNRGQQEEELKEVGGQWQTRD
jgi:hypothetical protein